MKKSLTSILLLLFLIPINFLFAQDFTYDNNGNLLSDETHNNLWDYNNRLTETLGMGDAPASTTYAYDPSGSRVKYSPAGGGSSTIYPTNLYEITGTTSTKHIYAGEDLVGNITGSTLYSVHSDHLTGSNVITNSSAGLEELLDYYPYGKIRLDEATSTFKTSRKYTGHNYDEDTDLNYMQARYQDGNTRRFLSQDPMFQAIGTDLSGFERTQNQLLSNPQELNSYSYVVNNPLKYKDQTGEVAVPVMFLAITYIFNAYNVADVAIDAYDFNNKVYKYPEQFSDEERQEAGMEIVKDGAFFGIGGLASKAWRFAVDATMATIDVISIEKEVTTDSFQEENNTPPKQDISQTPDSTLPSESSGPSPIKNEKNENLSSKKQPPLLKTAKPATPDSNSIKKKKKKDKSN